MPADFLKNILRKVGFDVIKYDARRNPALCLRKLLDRDGTDLVIDVGANTGQYGRDLREIGYQGDIISFEPLREAHQKLVEAANGDERWSVADRCAVGAAEETTMINVSGNSVSSSILDMAEAHVSAAPSSAYLGQEEIQVTTLNKVLADFCEEGRKCHLKIDTQGYESFVVEGASEVWSCINSIEMEISLSKMYEGGWLSHQALTRMAELGYRPFTMFPFFANKETGENFQIDSLFVRA